MSVPHSRFLLAADISSPSTSGPLDQWKVSNKTCLGSICQWKFASKSYLRPLSEVKGLSLSTQNEELNLSSWSIHCSPDEENPSILANTEPRHVCSIADTAVRSLPNGSSASDHDSQTQIPGATITDIPDPKEFILQKRKRFKQNLLARQRLAELNFQCAVAGLNRALARQGLSPPKTTPVSVDLDGKPKCQIPEFVRLLRGETSLDSRPNKALEIPTTDISWNKYRYRSRWHSIVHHGVDPEWKAPFKRQDKPPANHGSAKRALNIIVKHLRAGQDANRYLVLDLNLLPTLEGITCSPFGAVQKGEVDLTVDARIIHDLSFPVGESVNDNTKPDVDIEVSYDGAEALSNRALDVAEIFPKLQRMMTGDVNGAFRNIPVSAYHVGRFAGTIPELGILVIDLCCPFGWKNSPSSYWIAGAAIGHLYANSSPEWPLQPDLARENFDAKTWCDDHMSIEPDIGSRLAEADIALRCSMVSVLGSSACNEKKFSGWFTRGRALGLDWDLEALTVSMPAAKVLKALHRISNLSKRDTTTRTQLQKLLGSLRHVVTCIRPATPFFQRVAAVARAAPRFGSTAVTEDAKEDLR